MPPRRRNPPSSFKPVPSRASCGFTPRPGLSRKPSQTLRVKKAPRSRPSPLRETWVLRAQKWLKTARANIPTMYTKINGRWFYRSVQGRIPEIKQQADLATADQNEVLLLHRIAASGIPSAKGYANDEEYHLFEVRWPLGRFVRHPKLDKLMTEINAIHYGLLIGKFVKEPAPLAFEGRFWDLILMNERDADIMTRDPDGEPILWRSKDTYFKLLNVQDEDEIPTLTYVRSLAFDASRNDWRLVMDCANRVMLPAKFLYSCEDMHCKRFVDRMVEELGGLEEREVERDWVGEKEGKSAIMDYSSMSE